MRKFIYGPGIDEPICVIDCTGESDVWYFYHLDGLGSVLALSNTSGTIEASYSYDVFGDATTVTGDEHGNPYRFTGRRYDNETDLYYYRARMYAPDLGRFLQPDPIGYDDGMNMYAYVGNNPASFVDPFGLISLGMILNIHAVYNAPEEGIYLFEPQAAMTAMSAIYEQSMSEDREYGGYIYKYFNFYSYTKPIAGKARTVDLRPIKPKNPTASYHSHPGKKSVYWQFSGRDILNDNLDKVAGYVVVPTGEVFYHVLGELKEAVIGDVSKCPK